MLVEHPVLSAHILHTPHAVHSAIMARTCSALDALLANRPPAKPGKRLRILVQPAVPAAPVGQAAGEPGAGAAHGGAPAGAAGQGTAAAQGGAPAVMPGAGPAAVAPTQPAAGGGAAVAAAPAQPAITPEKLLCFLCHCYRPDLSIDQEAVPLLQLADIFGAAKMREAAAQVGACSAAHRATMRWGRWVALRSTQASSAYADQFVVLVLTLPAHCRR